MGRHMGQGIAKRRCIILVNSDAFYCGQHCKDRHAQFTKWAVVARECQGLGIKDQFRKPDPHHGRIAKGSGKHRFKRGQVKQCFIDVKDEGRAVGGLHGASQSGNGRNQPSA